MARRKTLAYNPYTDDLQELTIQAHIIMNRIEKRYVPQTPELLQRLYDLRAKDFDDDVAYQKACARYAIDFGIHQLSNREQLLSQMEHLAFAERVKARVVKDEVAAAMDKGCKDVEKKIEQTKCGMENWQTQINLLARYEDELPRILDEYSELWADESESSSSDDEDDEVISEPEAQHEAVASSGARPKPVIVNGEQEWEVERIMAHRYPRPVFANEEYLVHWRGYPEEHATWETEKNLKNNKALKQYQRLVWGKK